MYRKNPVEMPGKPDRCRLPRAGTYALTTTWLEQGAIGDFGTLHACSPPVVMKVAGHDPRAPKAAHWLVLCSTDLGRSHGALVVKRGRIWLTVGSGDRSRKNERNRRIVSASKAEEKRHVKTDYGIVNRI